MDVVDTAPSSVFDAEVLGAWLKAGHLDLNSDLPDFKSLPSEPDALQMVVSGCKEALLLRNQALQNAKSRFENLSSSHNELLQRSSAWKDELETIRDVTLKKAEQDLNLSRAENEGLQDRIKDLRFRAEESRRAIMRMQGERKTASGTADRRSVTASSLVGWNPAMVGGSDGDASRASSNAATTADERRGKRSTILFGSSSAAGNRASRHVRTGSGTRVPSSPGTSTTAIDESEGDTEQTPRSGGSMRPIRLSSGDYDERQSNDGLSISNGRRSVTAGGLAPPSSTSRPLSVYSQSPTPSVTSAHSGLGSPILEERPLAPTLSASPGLDDEPLTAKPTTPHLSSSGFGAMQLVRQKYDELTKMNEELRAMRIKLDEAVEARSASDSCLKALKDFIGEGRPEAGEEARAALRGVKLPPLPTDDDLEDSTGESKGANGKPAAGDTWGARWASLVRKPAPAGSTIMAGATSPAPALPRKTTGTSGSTGSELLSTSPSASSNLSGKSYFQTTEGVSPSDTSVQPPSALGGGLATFSSFFARTQNAVTTASASKPSPPPKDDVLPQDTDIAASPGKSAPVPAPTLNRLSTWFKKAPIPSEAESQDEIRVASTAAVASPPFASLEHSTLQKVDLDGLPASGLAGSDGDGGLGLTTTTTTSTEAANGSAPPVPPRKEIPQSAKAAKITQRAASVGEDGGLLQQNGPFVAPSFD